MLIIIYSNTIQIVHKNHTFLSCFSSTMANVTLNFESTSIKEKSSFNGGCKNITHYKHGGGSPLNN